MTLLPEVRKELYAAAARQAQVTRKVRRLGGWRESVGGLLMLALVGAVVVAVAVVFLSVHGPGARGRRAAVPEPASGSGHRRAPSPVRGATIHIVSGVVDLAAGDGALWVSGFGVLNRIDPTTGRVVARIRTPRTEDYSHVAVGLGSVWVTGDRYGSVVYRIDPRADRVAAVIHLAGSVQGIAVGAGRVWVTQLQGPGELLRIDPATDRVAGAPVKVGPGPLDVIYGLGALWVQNSSPSSVVRVDPATGRVATIGEADIGSPGFSGGAITTGYGSLWSAYGGALKRLNPETGAIIASIPIPRAKAIAIGSGEVWVFSGPRSRSPTLFYAIRGTGALWEINPRTNRIVRKRFRLTLQPIPLAVTASNLWVGDYSSQTVTQFRLVR